MSKSKEFYCEEDFIDDEPIQFELFVDYPDSYERENTQETKQ